MNHIFKMTLILLRLINIPNIFKYLMLLISTYNPNASAQIVINEYFKKCGYKKEFS